MPPLACFKPLVMSGLNASSLVPPLEARAIFGTDEIEAVEVLRPRPLGATVGVWRVRAGDGSAVLKLLRLGASPNPNWASSEDPSHVRWWRRELAALTDGTADLFQPDLRPPCLLHHADRPDGSLALWLEDLGEAATWSVERIAEAARVLGAAQARIAGSALPPLPRGFLRAYLEPRLQHLAEPFASRREEILARLDAVPQTICHCDLHPANLFPLRDRTVVIDWAYCSVGPIGTDAGVLASDALGDETFDASAANLLIDEVLRAYVEGFADDQLAAAAQTGFILGTALRYAWFPAWIEGSYGPPPNERRRRGATAAYETFRELALAHL